MALKRGATPRPAWAEGLTTKEFNFVEQYLLDLNATQAYCRCYHPEWHPIEKGTEHYDAIRVGGNAMRKKKSVAIAIGKAFAERGFTKAFVIDNYGTILRADIADCYDEHGRALPLHEIPEETRFAIVGYHPGEFGVEIKLSDKRAANDQLAKALRMFVERVEVSGPEGVPFTDPFDAAMKLADQMALRLQPPKAEESENA